MKGKTMAWMGLVTLMVTLLLVLPLAVGCAPAAEPATPTPAAEKPPITVKTSLGTQLTGPYASTVIPITAAHIDWVRHLNEDLDGFVVDGQRYYIDQMYADDKADMAVGLANFAKWAEAGSVCHIQWVTPIATAIAESQSPKYEIPGFGGGWTAWTPKEWAWVPLPAYDEGFAAMIRWVSETHWKETRPARVGFLVWDTAFGKNCVREELFDYYKANLNMEIVAVEYFPMTTVDFSTYLANLKEADVDYICYNALLSSTAPLAKEAERMGMLPANGVNWLLTYWHSGSPLVALAGASAVEGWMAMSQYPMASATNDADHPGIQEMVDCVKRWRLGEYWGEKGEKFDTNYLLGWTTSKYVTVAVKKTIERVGWPITGKDVQETLNAGITIPMGGAVPTSGFSKDEHINYHGIQIHQIQNGEWVQLTEWMPTPLVGPGIVEWRYEVETDKDIKL